MCMKSMTEPKERKSNAGRKRQWDTRVNVTMTDAMKGRIERAAIPPESALDVIREAIDRELKRRERSTPNPKG
jgi:hypothetical protein